MNEVPKRTAFQHLPGKENPQFLQDCLERKSIDITCISDLHGFYPNDLPEGDLLIVAGDLTARDTDKEYAEFQKWFKSQKYTKKIFISGNHDNQLEKITFPLWIDGYSDYLCDSGTEFEGLKIWGSPWTKTFKGMNPHCKAFTCDTEEELAEKWALIPDDTDILVTHSPPIAVLDRTIENKYAGSVSLSAQLGFLTNIKLHIFGHIHESYGKIDSPAYLPNYFDVCKHYSINASHVNERYQPVNKPIRIIL
jgi:Icc-related predicted phosphoesterase